MNNIAAYEIGCGRYIQQTGILADAAEELGRFGRKLLLIYTTLSETIAAPALEAGLACGGFAIRRHIHDGCCCVEDAQETALRYGSGIEVVVGIGGGTVIDFAKIVADLLGAAMVTVPTSSATCCAYTPLSVCYTHTGKAAGTRKYPWSISAVLADMEILSRQPPRLLVAGACDALAKKIEIEQRIQGKSDLEIDPGFGCCHALARFLHDRIRANLDEVYRDACEQRNSKLLYDMVYYSIAGAGTVSGLARGSRQTAMGHKFYLFIRTRFTEECACWLHGELVAIGLVGQLAFNGEEQQAGEFRRMLRKMRLPCCMDDLGIPAGPEVFKACCNFIRNSSAMQEAGPAELLRMRRAVELIFAPAGT